MRTTSKHNEHNTRKHTEEHTILFTFDNSSIYSDSYIFKNFIIDTKTHEKEPNAAQTHPLFG
jgi:hypothetical protein